MTTTPEIPKNVPEIPVSGDQEKSGEVEKKVEIPEHIEKGSVGVISSQQSDVSDLDQATSQSSPSSVSVTVPGTQTQLQDLAKGSPVNAVTWLANFWLRIIKKAVHFGWKIITKQSKSETENGLSLSETSNQKSSDGDISNNSPSLKPSEPETNNQQPTTNN